MVLCSYGCNKEAKFKLKNGKDCCSSHPNNCDIGKKKNSDAIKKAHADGRLKCYFTNETRNWNKGLRKFTTEQILIYDPPVSNGYIKEILMQESTFVHICCLCNNTIWLDKPITLELDHIDGNNINNVRSNLRFICPNCHSQTSNWKGRNKSKNKTVVSDEQFIEALKTTPNIRKALKKLHLTPKAKNYTRAYELLGKYSIIQPVPSIPEPLSKPAMVLPKEELLNLIETHPQNKIAERFNISIKRLRSYCKNNNILLYTKRNRKKKFEVTKEELEKLVSSYSLVKIGKMFNVSDNAIKKRCIKYGINYKDIS